MNSPELNRILYGSDCAIPTPIILKAGLIDLIFQGGMIRQITFDTIPVCNRVYFALRDRHWNTIPGSFTIMQQSIDSSGFKLTFKGMYSQGDINLESTFDLHGRSSGELTFSFKAVARTSFYRNRIGFCTLLPIDQCTGKKYGVIQSENGSIKSTFPEQIAPWQPLLDIKSISYPVTDFANVTATFDGDLFEMEDQRNWTDYSYKIYSTRLSDPLPVMVEKGTSIEQTVTFTFASLRNTTGSIRKNKRNLPVLLNNLSGNTCTVPQIGTCLDYSKVDPISSQYIGPFAYIRSDIFFDLPDHRNVIFSTLSLCKSLLIKPEFVLYCTDDITKELALVAECISASGIKPARISILKQSEVIVSELTITKAKTILGQALPETPLVFGTDKYFVELNRNRRAVDLCEHICYSMNPQVHTFDNDSIMENLPGISATILAAQALFGNKKIHITPITLRPRANRSNPLKDGGPDMRLYGLFGAAWTAGVLFYSIPHNVGSLCFFQLNGDHGIFDNIRKVVTPAYHLLSKVAPFSGGQFSRMTSENTKSLVAFHLQKESRSLLVIANLTNTSQTLEVTNTITGKAQLIDSTSFEELCTNYTKWKNFSKQVTYKNAIALPEYGVMLIERDS